MANFYKTLSLKAMSLVLAADASAQESPAYNISNIAAGGTTYWSTSAGLLERRALGSRGDLILFEITRQLSGGHVTVFEFAATINGNVVWQREVGLPIGTTRYSQHDCSFSEEKCSAEIFVDGELAATMLVVTEYIDEIRKRTTTTSYVDGEVGTTIDCGIYDDTSTILALFSSKSDGYTYWQKITSGPQSGVSSAMLARVIYACAETVLIS